MLAEGKRREDYLASHKDRVKCEHCKGTGYAPEVEKPKPSPHYPRHVPHPDGRKNLDGKEITMVVATAEQHAAFNPEDHAALQAEIEQGLG